MSPFLSGYKRDCSVVEVVAQEHTHSNLRRLEEGKRKRLSRELHLASAFGCEILP